MPTFRPFLVLCVLLAVFSSLGAGCRRRSAVRGAVRADQTGGDAVQVGGGETAHGTPREQLDQLDRVLRAQGFVPVGPVMTAPLPAHGITAYQMDVARGHCYVITVLGSEGSDPNLVMLDPAGRDVAHNVLPDSHPWVSFCAARGGRFVARIQMTSRGGDFFFAPYMIRGRRGADLTAFFGGSQTSGPQIAQIDAETTQRLSGLDQQLASQNFQRVGEPSGLVLRNREERVFQLSLEQGRCYAFGTLGGPGTTDTDVFLQDGSGQRLTADSTTQRDALVQYCSPETGNYTLQVRMFGGEGPVFTVGYVQAQAGQATPPAEVPVIAETSTAGAGLDENFTLLDADMRARGYEGFGDPQRNQLAEGGEQNYEVDLEGGKCYAILAVGDSGVRDMSLSLTDSAGREVDRDEAGDARPTVRVCPETTGRYLMHVRMVSGSGSYVYAPYRWPRGTRLGDMVGVLYVRLSEVTALLNVESFQPDPGYTLERGRLRREGDSATHRFTLQGGQCYSIVVVGGAGVRDLDVTLSQGTTQIATDFGVRNAFPSVRHCAEGTGQYTVAVRAAAGSGDYVYQVFSQQARALSQ